MTLPIMEGKTEMKPASDLDLPLSAEATFQLVHYLCVRLLASSREYTTDEFLSKLTGHYSRDMPVLVKLAGEFAKYRARERERIPSNIAHVLFENQISDPALSISELEDAAATAIGELENLLDVEEWDYLAARGSQPSARDA
ncbi:MAG: hypothetical protein ACM3ZU_01420 [Bacteroidota bacterium]